MGQTKNRQRKKSKGEREREQSAVTGILVMMGTWLTKKGPLGGCSDVCRGMAMKRNQPHGKGGVERRESEQSHLLA